MLPRARATAEIQSCTDSLELYERRDAAGQQKQSLENEESELEAKIEIALASRSDVETRIVALEERFTSILRSLSLPGFLEQPVGHIDRSNYLPSVNNRPFDTLQSEGLSIEVNVAHALAHHTTAIELDLPLPNILFVDGVSGAFGEEGKDPERISAIYDQLSEAAKNSKEELQIIVSDTFVPEEMRSYVKLELSESERLIPQDDLQRLQERVESS